MPDGQEPKANADDWLAPILDLFAKENSAPLSPLNLPLVEGPNMPDVDLDALCEVILAGIALPKA